MFGKEEEERIKNINSFIDSFIYTNTNYVVESKILQNIISPKKENVSVQDIKKALHNLLHCPFYRITEFDCIEKIRVFLSYMVKEEDFNDLLNVSGKEQTIAKNIKIFLPNIDFLTQIKDKNKIGVDKEQKYFDFCGHDNLAKKGLIFMGKGMFDTDSETIGYVGIKKAEKYNIEVRIYDEDSDMYDYFYNYFDKDALLGDYDFQQIGKNKHTMTWLSNLFDRLGIPGANRQAIVDTIEDPIIFLSLFFPNIKRWFVKEHKGQSEQQVTENLNKMLKMAKEIFLKSIPTSGIAEEIQEMATLLAKGDMQEIEKEKLLKYLTENSSITGLLIKAIVKAHYKHNTKEEIGEEELEETVNKILPRIKKMVEEIKEYFSNKGTEEEIVEALISKINPIRTTLDVVRGIFKEGKKILMVEEGVKIPEIRCRESTLFVLPASSRRKSIKKIF